MDRPAGHRAVRWRRCGGPSPLRVRRARTMAPMIVVAGEALIDLLVHPDGRLAATPGGGPFNTARTIARLGGTVAYPRLPVDGPVRDDAARRARRRRRGPVADREHRRADDAGHRRTRRARRGHVSLPHRGDLRAAGRRHRRRGRPGDPAPRRSTSGRSASCWNRSPRRSPPGSARSPPTRWSCSTRTAGRRSSRTGRPTWTGSTASWPGPTSSRSAATTSPISTRAQSRSTPRARSPAADRRSCC